MRTFTVVCMCCLLCSCGREAVRVTAPSCEIRGRVTDEGGNSLSGVCVAMRTSGPIEPLGRFLGKPPSLWSGNIISGEDGQFKLIVSEADSIWVDFEKDGYIPKRLEDGPFRDMTKDWDITLKLKKRISLPMPDMLDRIERQFQTIYLSTTNDWEGVIAVCADASVVVGAEAHKVSIQWKEGRLNLSCDTASCVVAIDPMEPKITDESWADYTAIAPLTGYSKQVQLYKKSPSTNYKKGVYLQFPDCFARMQYDYQEMEFESKPIPRSGSAYEMIVVTVSFDLSRDRYFIYTGGHHNWGRQGHATTNDK